MKKGLGRPALLALVLTLVLTACAEGPEEQPGFDAGVYVTGVLNATYLGRFEEDYLAMVDLTEAQAQTEYENGILWEINRFYNAYGVETTSEELEEGLKELYRQIYAQASLTVTSVEAGEEDSFLVEVRVEPLDIARLVYGELEEARKKFLDQYPENVQNTMTTEEYRAFDAAWSQMILELYREKLALMCHRPSQTVKLRVEKDSQGYYGINTTDFQALDKLVIDYSEPETPQPEESPKPEESTPPQESQSPEESEKPQESPPPQESVDPNDRTPTPPTTRAPNP